MDTLAQPINLVWFNRSNLTKNINYTTSNHRVAFLMEASCRRMEVYAVVLKLPA